MRLPSAVLAVRLQSAAGAERTPTMIDSSSVDVPLDAGVAAAKQQSLAYAGACLHSICHLAARPKSQQQLRAEAAAAA